MRKLRPAVACCLVLALSGCLETTFYKFHGEVFTVTDDGTGRVTVRNHKTGVVVEESRGGHGTFANKLLTEGEVTRGLDVIAGRTPPPARNDIAERLAREGGGD